MKLLPCQRIPRNQFLRVIEFGLATLIAFTCGTQIQAQNTEQNQAISSVEMLTCLVLVLDPEGNPIEGVSVACKGMFNKGRLVEQADWDPVKHGPIPELKTDKNGLVEVPYPKYVTGEFETGRISFTIDHPGFVGIPNSPYRFNTDDPIDFKLARGFRIAMTAVNGTTGEKITHDLYGVVGGPLRQWKLHANGMLVSPVLAKNKCLVRIVQLIDDQPALFSELIEIEPGDRSRVLIKDVKLFLGTRVEGKIAQSVERPIKHGHVAARIVHSTKSHDLIWIWSESTPINEDGSFVFESVPSDEVLQMIPICDGWVPADPDVESILDMSPDAKHHLNKENQYALPQVVSLAGKSVQTTLSMKKATSIQIIVTSPLGEPLPGAKTTILPIQLWFNYGYGQVLGTDESQREILVQTLAGGWKSGFKNPFQTVTNNEGVATFTNVPAYQGLRVDVTHDHFEMPITNQRQYITVDLKPDVVVKVEVQMKEKG